MSGRKIRDKSFTDEESKRLVYLCNRHKKKHDIPVFKTSDWMCIAKEFNEGQAYYRNARALRDRVYNLIKKGMIPRIRDTTPESIQISSSNKPSDSPFSTPGKEREFVEVDNNVEPHAKPLNVLIPISDSHSIESNGEITEIPDNTSVTFEETNGDEINPIEIKAEQIDESEEDNERPETPAISVENVLKLNLIENKHEQELKHAEEKHKLTLKHMKEKHQTEMKILELNVKIKQCEFEKIKLELKKLKN